MRLNLILRINFIINLKNWYLWNIIKEKTFNYDRIKERGAVGLGLGLLEWFGAWKDKIIKGPVMKIGAKIENLNVGVWCVREKLHRSKTCIGYIRENGYTPLNFPWSMPALEL